MNSIAKTSKVWSPELFLNIYRCELLVVRRCALSIIH